MKVVKLNYVSDEKGVNLGDYCQMNKKNHLGQLKKKAFHCPKIINSSNQFSKPVEYILEVSLEHIPLLSEGGVNTGQVANLSQSHTIAHTFIHT